MQRPARLAVLGAAALAALYLGLALRSPVSVGFFGDDAVYVTTARALAEGRGYRHVSIPGEPLQTKYPVLYPALLAAVFRAWPEFPRNFGALLAPTALAAAGAVALAALYWRRVFGESPRSVAAVAGLAALAPAWLGFVRYAMSELLYALLATAALWCFDARAPRAGGRAHTARLALGSLLTAAAVHTRTIGVSLALAAVALPLLRRRFADALLVGAVLVACLAPWWSWQSAAAAANGAMQHAFLIEYELGYSGGFPADPLEALRVAGQNLLRLAFGLGYFQLALPLGFVRGAIERGGPRLVLLHVVCHAALALALVGCVHSARRGLRTLHVYALAYAALVLGWAFSPYRFLVPWTPFLVYFTAAGLRAAVAATVGRLPRGGPKIAWAIAGLSYATVFALFVLEDLKLARSTPEAFYARELPVDWGELRAVERWLGEHSQPDDVIASAHPETIFLATGRRGHYFWPESDPVAFDYGADRQIRRFAMLPAASEAKAREREIERELGHVYREAQIAWYVAWAPLASAHSLARVMQQRPGWFEPRYTTPGRTFEVYRVRIP
jgi:hypothetical protein